MVLSNVEVQRTLYKYNRVLFISIIEKNPFIIYLFRIYGSLVFMIPKNPILISWGSLN